MSPEERLLVSAGLPVVGRILEGTKEPPYLAVRIGLDPALVRAVLMESGLSPHGPVERSRPWP